MITDREKYHYLAVTNSSALLQGNSSNEGHFYCLNCFNSYKSKNKLIELEEICNSHDSCHIEMPEWVDKTLKYNPEEKSLKAPFAIHLDSECQLTKYNLPKTTLKNLTHKKKARHETSGWAMFTRCPFDKKENKLNYYRGKYCIEKLCKKLKECPMGIIDYEEKNDIINP